MNKQAFLQGVTDSLKTKFSDPAFTHRVAIPTMNRVFSHNTASTLLGAGLGVGGGLLGTALQSNQRPKKWGRNALLGGILGAGAGGAASLLAPEASKAVTHHLIRQPAGRVITNLVDPYNYQEDKFKRVSETPLPKLLRAVTDDQPLYLNPMAGKSSPSFDSTGYSLREPLYRKIFGLPNRSKNFSTLYAENPDGSVRFNQSHPLGSSLLDSIASQGPVAQQGADSIGAPIGTTTVHTNPALGHYLRKIVDTDQYQYDDTWDFALNPHEALDSRAHWLRYLLDNLTQPVRITGRTSAIQ